MPPVIARRTAALPTIVSLSKLLHIIPAALNSKHAKRGAQLAMVAGATLAENEREGEEEAGPEKMAKLIFSVGLVLLGGVFAGLTLALMGSDDLNLRVLAASSDDPKERAAASKVLRLLARGRHWVLVVLLLGNVIVNESLPIFLDDVLGGGLAAVVASTVMIVIFGEVIPQAVCVRYGLAIGGACAPMVHFLMILFAPIAWPIAKLLDWVLGHDAGHTYKKAELKSFLQFHREGEEPLRDDEIIILNGVLSLNDRHVKEIMTPIDDCLVLPANKVLDHDAVDSILISGFSRIPVHEPGQPDNFVGMLLVKRLITYNPDDKKQVSSFPLLPLPEAAPELNCFQALDYFQTGRAHLLLISDFPGQRGGALGVLSLEDLIEEIIGEEIIDETDRYQDNHSKRKAQRKATREIMLGIIERQRVINAFSRRPSGTSASRAQSPNPSRPHSQPREGILVNLAGTSLTQSPLISQSTLPVDIHETQEIVLTSPGGEQNLIVEMSPPEVDAGASSLTIKADGAALDSDSTVTATKIGTASAGTTADAPNTDTTDTDPVDKTDAASASASTSGESSSATATTGSNKPKTNGSSKRGRKGKKGKSGDEAALLEPFPSLEAFDSAAHAFLDKYDGQSAAVMGPERTNVGWAWRSVSSKWRGEHGYLYRRNVKWVTQPSATPSPSHESTTPEPVDGQDLLEEEEDDAAAVTAPTASGQYTARRIEREYSIVWSPTYRVPMLCVRAWDANGVPLPLDEIVTHVLRAGASNLSSGEQQSDALMLPASAGAAPFPLLQQTEHPVTGDIVWSVHPCEVRGAVAEIMRTGEEDGEAEGQEGEFGVRWLETWVMLSDSVVDLAV